MKKKGYTILMGLLLTAIGIKYEGSNTNPFNHPTPSTLLFLTAASCHFLASTAEMRLQITIYIFNVSGIVGCQALMWILVPQLLCWSIINLLLLLLAPFCFNYYNTIIDLIRQTFCHVPNLEACQAQEDYTILMTLFLTTIGINYEGSNTNPFNHPTPSTMLFLVAASCHFLASTAEMSLLTTIFIFHVSGIVGCQSLMWILVPQLLCRSISNLLLLLLVPFCFNNYNIIIDLIRRTFCHVSNLGACQARFSVIAEVELYWTYRPTSGSFILRCWTGVLVMIMKNVNAFSFAPVEGSTMIFSVSVDIKYSTLPMVTLDM
ncbi:hypothetical protein CR513_48213, partial [Mucuna pruriens]